MVAERGYKRKTRRKLKENNRTSDNMASENRSNAENVREIENSAGISNDNSDAETAWKRDKARTKSYFTCSKNKLIFFL